MLITAINNVASRLGLKPFKWLDIFLWSLGGTILVGLTIGEIRPLFYEYDNNNVVTKMVIAADNKTIKSPHLTLCIPYSSSALQHIANALLKNETLKCNLCAKLTNRSWDVWEDKKFFAYERTSDKYQQVLTTLLLKKLLTYKGNDDFDVLSAKNYDWNQPILEAIWNLMVCIKDLDFHNDFDSDAWNNSCFPDFDVSSVLSTGTIEKLFDHLIDRLCQHLKFAHESCQIILSVSSSVIYAPRFCFALPRLKSTWSASFKATGLGNVSWTALADTTRSFNVAVDTVMLTWALSPISLINNDMIFTSDTLDDELLEGREIASLKYRVALTVSGKQDARIPCYSDSRRAACKGNCVVANIRDRCRCVPFTFRRVSQSTIDLPYCNPVHYADCRLNMSEEDDNCHNACSNPCRYTSYHWHVTRKLIPTPGRRVFALSVTPIVAPFVDFSIKVKDTPEQFLSQVAAVFSLYLGFSGLSLVALLIHFVETFAPWRNSRSQNRCDATTQELDVTRSTSRVFRLDATDSAADAQSKIDALSKEVKELKQKNETFLIQQNTLESVVAELKASFDQIKKKIENV